MQHAIAVRWLSVVGNWNLTDIVAGVRRRTPFFRVCLTIIQTRSYTECLEVGLSPILSALHRGAEDCSQSDGSLSAEGWYLPTSDWESTSCP